MTLVVDASAVFDLLRFEPNAGAISGHLADHEGDVHAPHLLDVEVLSALRRAVRVGGVLPERADGVLADLAHLTVQRYPHEGLVPRMWELRQNVSAYDATYVALAEALAEGGVPLLTTDARLARAAREHGRVREVLLA